jgi:Fe-S cluster biosynthesis and repair protein YggX
MVGLRGAMSFVCKRCGKEGEAPPPHRVPFTGQARADVLSGICAACWKEWEGVEVKVINEYRLSFLDPQHREMLQRACFDFLGLPQGSPATE